MTYLTVSKEIFSREKLLPEKMAAAVFFLFLLIFFLLPRFNRLWRRFFVYLFGLQTNI